MVASAIFYLRLELRLGLLMAVLLALSVWLGHTLAGLSTAAWLAWGIGLFVVGWNAVGWIFAVIGLGAIVAGLGAGRSLYVNVQSEKV